MTDNKKLIEHIDKDLKHITGAITWNKRLKESSNCHLNYECFNGKKCGSCIESICARIAMLIQIKEIVEKHGSRVEFGFGRIGIGVAGEKGKPTNELMIWNLKTEQPIGSEVKNTKGKTSDDVNTISRWRFNNLESLQVVIDALNDIKADVFGEQQPQPDEDERDDDAELIQMEIDRENES